jgi:predicted membrane channel-forming protein YqfA (hemolysin III family)
MQVVLIILSIGLLGIIIYFAVSPKSSKLLKLAAFIALGLIVLSLAICGIFLIIGPGEDDGDIFLPIFHDAAPQADSSGNTTMVVSFFVALFGILGLIIFLALREQRKKAVSAKKPPPAPVFQKKERFELNNTSEKEQEESFDEESFDIEIK